MYLLELAYFVLAFAEILVLFASAVAVLVLVVRHVVRDINGLVDTAIDAASAGKEPRLKSLNPFKIAIKSRPRRIPGGHNEIF